MTVSNQQTEFPYTGNGVTVTFAYSCQVQKAGDLQVYVNGSAVTSGITKNGIGSLSGGSVTFSVAPESGAAVRLERAVVLERTTDYQQNGDFLARVVNPDFDRIWMALQQQNSVMGRAIRYPKSDVNPITELPAAAARANRLLGFNDLGQQILFAPTSGSALDLAITLASIIGSTLIGNGGETVAQSFDALQMASFSVLRAYAGPRRAVKISALRTGGPFTADPADTTSPDDNAMTIVDANGMRWKRQYDGEISAWWFGADPTGVNDSLAALTAFYAYCDRQGIFPGAAQFGTGRAGLIPAGKYKLTDTLFRYLGNGTVSSDIRTAGSDQTIFFGAIGAKPLFTLVGGSGRFSRSVHGGVALDGVSSAVGSEGIRLDGIGGIDFQRFAFRNVRMPIRFYNLSPGNFTEGCIFTGPEIETTCESWMQFSVGAGTNSFRSSGVIGGVFQSAFNVGKIIIDDGAFPYFCYADFTFWGGPTTIFVNQNTGTAQATFRGNITFETGTTAILFGIGQETFLAGELSSLSGSSQYQLNVQLGKLFLCESSQQANNGSFVSKRKPWRTAGSAIGSAGATISIDLTKYIDNTSNHINLLVGITSAGYQYDIAIEVTKITGVSTITAVKINDALFNQAGWGAPTLSAVYPNVRLANASWPLDTAYTVTYLPQNAIFAQ